MDDNIFCYAFNPLQLQSSLGFCPTSVFGYQKKATGKISSEAPCYVAII